MKTCIYIYIYIHIYVYVYAWVNIARKSDYLREYVLQRYLNQFTNSVETITFWPVNSLSTSSQSFRVHSTYCDLKNKWESLRRSSSSNNLVQRAVENRWKFVFVLHVTLVAATHVLQSSLIQCMYLYMLVCMYPFALVCIHTYVWYTLLTYAWTQNHTCNRWIYIYTYV